MKTALLRIWFGAWPLLLSAGAVMAGEAEGHESGNPVSVDMWQAAYTIVVFVVLLVILSLFAFPKILEGLKRREDFIRNSLDEARKSREQAENCLKEYEAKLDRARAEATAIVDEAHRDAETVRKRIEEEARVAGDGMIDRAKREINLARDHALESIFSQSVELAASLAAAALRRQMSPEEHQRLVQDTLRDLQTRERTAN
jgi:F-type H+-transporting ATPase subunit b